VLTNFYITIQQCATATWSLISVFHLAQAPHLATRYHAMCHHDYSNTHSSLDSNLNCMNSRHTRPKCEAANDENHGTLEWHITLNVTSTIPPYTCTQSGNRYAGHAAGQVARSLHPAPGLPRSRGSPLRCRELPQLHLTVLQTS
jgi:hypothetical protein